MMRMLLLAAVLAIAACGPHEGGAARPAEPEVAAAVDAGPDAAQVASLSADEREVLEALEAPRFDKSDNGLGAGDTPDEGVREVKISVAAPDGEPSGLDREDIDKVIKSHKATLLACYQRELAREPGIGGKLIIRFRIDASGDVTSAAAVEDESTLDNAEVEACVLRQIRKLRFPAKGGAVVSYPFIFSDG